MKRVSILILVSSALLLTGCDDAPPKTAADANNGGISDRDASEHPDKDPNKSSITIGEKLRKLCDIPSANFAFDSASLSPSAKNALDALAKCFVEGPAKNHDMRLVGHADNRGEEQYNMALGQKRAGSVGQYLSKKGLADSRMETTSRGELEARGEDEAGWAKDRRVEISLAE